MPATRRVRAAAIALAAVAVVGFPNFGVFHAMHYGPVHYWDAFHYFMGAKYLPELGYGGLYEATYAAGRELGAFDYITHVRDLGSYALRDARQIDLAAVRARFTPARWAAFKRDLTYLGPRIREWPALLQDHGYNDPPPRAWLLHALVRLVPANPVSLTALTSLDYLVVGAAFWAVARAFGPLPTALALAFFALSFFARFDFIGGSILRFDWIAALLAGVAALARGAGARAGLLLGYAVAARLFPAVFLLPLLVKWWQARRAGAPDGPTRRCLAAATALLAAVGLVLALAGEPRTFAGEYAAKIARHARQPYVNHVGLGALLVFARTPWTQGPGGVVQVSQAAVEAARPAPWVLPLAVLAYALAALPLVRRAPPLQSLLYAVPLVFVALSPAGYYYSFLVLLVLLPWQGGATDPVRLAEMAGLCLVMAAAYGFELVSDQHLPLFHMVSIELAVYLAAWLALEHLRRRAGPDALRPVPAAAPRGVHGPGPGPAV